MKPITSLVNQFKLHKNINQTFADQVIVSGVNFLTGILIARYLGIEQFGVFSIVWMLVQFASSLQLAMIITPMMNLLPKQPSGLIPAYFSSVWIHQLIFSFLSVVILILLLEASRFILPDLSEINLYFLLPFTAVVISTQLQDFLRRYFFATDQTEEALLNDSISYLGQVVALILLYLFNKTSIESILWAISGTSFCAVLVGLFRLKMEKWWNFTLLKDITHKHWSFSKWLIMSTILQWGSGNFLLVATGFLLGMSTLGLVKAVQNIFGVANVMMQGLNNFVPVQVSKLLTTKGLSSAEAYTTKIAFSSTIIMLLLFSPLLLFPNQVVLILYNFQLSDYEYIIYWFVLINIAMIIFQMLSLLLNAVEEPRPQFISYLISTVISLVVAYPVIEKYSIVGTLGGMLFVVIVRIVLLFASYQGIRDEKRMQFKGDLKTGNILSH